MFRKKIAIGFLLFICPFIFGGPVLAQQPIPAPLKLSLHTECTENSQCGSGDCEDAKSGKSYCVCQTDQHCSQFSTANDNIWRCISDDDEDLHYCKAEISGKEEHGGLLANRSTIANTLKLDDSEIKRLTSKPQTKITIPGLKFSESKIVESEEKGAYINIPFLGEYLSAAYRYGIAAAGIMAVVIIINAGFLWSRSAGNSQTITAQKESIEKAIIGIIIAVSSFSILYFINPKLTTFDNLKVQYIKPQTIFVDAAGEPATSGPISAETGSNGVPYFAQWKGPWADKKPGDPEWPYTGAKSECSTIQQRGCGPTSLAMVLAYYGQNVTPLETSRWALGCQGAWQAFGTLEDFPKHWPGLKMEIMTKRLGPEKLKSRILGLLAENKPLVYNCAPCQGVKADGTVAPEYRGHYVVLTGIHPDNKNYGSLSNDKIFLTVNDPGRNPTSRIMAMSLAQVLQNFIVGIYVDQN